MACIAVRCLFAWAVQAPAQNVSSQVPHRQRTIASAAVGMSGREGDLFRRVIGWSLLFTAVMCVLVYLQSTSVLSWMVAR